MAGMIIMNRNDNYENKVTKETGVKGWKNDGV